MNSLITIMTCLYSRVLDLAKFTYEYAMVSEMLPGWNWMELDREKTYGLLHSALQSAAWASNDRQLKFQRAYFGLRPFHPE